MTISIAQSRQQLSALIAAAQLTPQVITNRSKPVAVLVSADYFEHSEAAVKRAGETFYQQLLRLREVYAPDDNTGLMPMPGDEATRLAAWSRSNAFADPE